MTTKKKTTKAATRKGAKTAKAATAKKATKPAAKKTAAKANGSKAKEAKPKKLSALNAAFQVLSQSNQPMNCQELIEAMTAKGLWTSPGGATPHATLYAAIVREINTKGSNARFRKTDKGRFTAAANS